MRIIEPSFKVLYPVTDEEWLREFKLIESAGRTAYRSEDKITDDSYADFIRMIIKRDHLAVLEFGNMVVEFVTDRGVSHELVRHRLCSYVQESTRYCNYGDGKFGDEIAVIQPTMSEHNGFYLSWLDSCRQSEKAYLDLIKGRHSPQIARSVLPNSLATKIVVKANFREWRYIFQLRAVSKAAHPDMRKLMLPLYGYCRILYPFIFSFGDPE